MKQLIYISLIIIYLNKNLLREVGLQLLLAPLVFVAVVEESSNREED